MTDLFIVPAGTDSEPYVELGSRGATGTVFRKHILNLGPLHYGGKTYDLDEDFYNRLSRNFENGVSMVQAPVADGSNKHSEDPLRNGGEVIGVERDGNKVFTVIDVRDPKVVEGLRNRTIMGASAMMSMNYEDSRTGQKVGPALLHHCFTNRPHVLDLDPYEEIVAATRDSADMDFESPIVLATEENVPEPTKEELLAQLKEKHGIDVAALTAAAEAKVDLSVIADALKDTGTVQLTGESVTQSDVLGAIVELNAKNQTLGAEVARLSKKDADRTAQEYVDSGRLLPKTKDSIVTMLLAGQDIEPFLAPEDAPFIRMNAQEGQAGDGDAARKHDFDIDTEINRLADVQAGLGGSPNGKK